MTPAGIEPATFRFVAQHLNHCATHAHTFVYIHTCINTCFHTYVQTYIWIHKIRTQNHFSAIFFYIKCFEFRVLGIYDFSNCLINKLCIERSRTYARTHSRTHMLTHNLIHMTFEDEALTTSIFVHLDPCDCVISVFILWTFCT